MPIVWICQADLPSLPGRHVLSEWSNARLELGMLLFQLYAASYWAECPLWRLSRVETSTLILRSPSLRAILRCFASNPWIASPFVSSTWHFYSCKDSTKSKPWGKKRDLITTDSNSYLHDGWRIYAWNPSFPKVLLKNLLLCLIQLLRNSLQGTSFALGDP